MENPNLASPADGPKPASPTPSLPVAVYDDIGLDPRAAEKLKILVNDLNQHVARLSQVTVENPDGTIRDGFSDEFSGLERESTVDFYSGDRSSARKVYNRNKNRYTNVLPYEDTRVVLDYNPCVGADYINANYVDGEVPGSERAYIATQGPLASTVVDFWRMIWQTGCRIIVMLTRLKEHDRLTSMIKGKCERYYPHNRPDENVNTFNGFRITLLEKEYAQLKQAPGQHNLVRRKLLLEDSKSGESRIVHHFQYTEWPDHGLPAAGTLGFRELLHMVDAVNGIDYSPKPPIVVHCSAGIGRTGTFCTVHSVLRKLHYTLKTHPDSPPFGVTQLIFDTVLRLRKQRFGMVQTKDQFMFCYRCLAEALEEEQRRHDELELVRKEKSNASSSSSSPPSSASSPTAEGAKKQKNDT